jgi:iron only hydrogenase large subunit-like protein
MVRRTLEELCQDKKAEGKNLKDRIHSLRDKVVLPRELFDALDDLRLLGNDAAHIEASSYEVVGSDEVEAGIEVTKEILKAVYQLDDLVNRLRSLKKN